MPACSSGNQTPSRMLKKAASGVLASLRSSTGTRPPHHSAARTDVVLLIRRTVRPRGYASGSSLAAALLDSLFEHPALLWRQCHSGIFIGMFRMNQVFPKPANRPVRGIDSPL
jgi:hypothetical protein